MKLRDAEHLKAELIQWLLKGNLDFTGRTKVIAVEVPFSPHKRKADVVVIGRDLHALEIKGRRDRLDALPRQLNDYHKVFDRVSVVTTVNHLIGTIRRLRCDTGLILAIDGTFHVVRRARPRRRLCKSALLSFLAKRDIAKLLKIKNLSGNSTDQVRSMAKKRLTLRRIRLASIAKLRGRYQDPFRLFMSDKGEEVHIDDLLSLTGYVSDLA